MAMFAKKRTTYEKDFTTRVTVTYHHFCSKNAFALWKNGRRKGWQSTDCRDHRGGR